MSVIVAAPRRLDGLTWRLSWSSDLLDPLFRIYQDGLCVDTTTATQKTFGVSAGETLVIEVLDTDAAPAQAFPGRFSVTWYARNDAARYLIEECMSDAWTLRATINESGGGFYSWQTRFLEDMQVHRFRVIPVGISGNEGDPLELSQLMVRNPSPPAQNFEYSSTNQTITVLGV